MGGSRVATYYLPFCNYRGTAPNQTITDRDFTGQPQNRAVGLLYYQARFYVPSIGRFASADTLVPDPANPQSWNRYSYVNNQPLVYNDPTGHWLESAWDALNVGMGIASFVDNVKQGNYGWAAVDALGVVVDAAALVTPIVPGGVGAIIKGTRVADTAVDAIQTVNQVSNAAQAANQAVSAARFIPVGVTDDAGQAIGHWVSRNIGNSDWARYQARITGVEGAEFMFNGVRFDGAIGTMNTAGEITDLVLLDAKNWSVGFMHGLQNNQSMFNSKIDDALKQVTAANGNRVEWHFSVQEVADWWRGVLRERNILGIDVIWTP